MVFGLCFYACTLAMSSTLYYVEDAAIVSNKLAVVIQRSTKTYHQTLGDKIFGDLGRLTEEVNTYFYCATSDLATNCPNFFGKSLPLLTFKANESVSLSFTHQPNIVTYHLAFDHRAGLIEVNKGTHSAISTPEKLVHTNCKSPDGLLVWQDQTSLWSYDVLKKDFVLFGMTPLAVKDNSWQAPMYPSSKKTFYSKGAIFQWKDRTSYVRKYSVVTGEEAGIISVTNMTVHAVLQSAGRVFCVFTSKLGNIRIVDDDGMDIAVFPENKIISSIRQPMLYLPEGKHLIIVDNFIHPKDRSVTVHWLDCTQMCITTQKIKLPLSL